MPFGFLKNLVGHIAHKGPRDGDAKATTEDATTERTAPTTEPTTKEPEPTTTTKEPEPTKSCLLYTSPSPRD